MAKTITKAELVTRKLVGGAGNTNIARVTVECPVSELAALLALAGLTNAVPTAVSNFITAVGDTGGA